MGFFSNAKDVVPGGGINEHEMASSKNRIHLAFPGRMD